MSHIHPFKAALIVTPAGGKLLVGYVMDQFAAGQPRVRLFPTGERRGGNPGLFEVQTKVLTTPFFLLMLTEHHKKYCAKYWNELNKHHYTKEGKECREDILVCSR